MAEGGYSGRRVRHYSSDVQGHVLTGRFGANRSESVPSYVGQFQPLDAAGRVTASWAMPKFIELQTQTGLRCSPIDGHGQRPKKAVTAWYEKW